VSAPNPEGYYAQPIGLVIGPFRTTDDQGNGQMVNRLMLISMAAAVFLGGCMSSGMSDQPNYVSSQIMTSPLPAGSISNPGQRDDLPDDVGGPM
jgi:hypothetical protein